MTITEELVTHRRSERHVDPDCGICERSRREGWNGLPAGTWHCRDCHLTIASRKEAHCATCCEHFATPKAFDFHLSSTGCADPAEVRDTKDRERLISHRERQGRPVWSVRFWGEYPKNWGQAEDLA